MRTTPILPLIRIPIIRLRVYSLPLIRRHQLLVIVDPRASPHNLPNAGHQAVDALGDAGVVRRALHVEGLDLRGEVREENGAVDHVCHFALGGFGDVVPEGVGLSVFVLDVVRDEPVDGVGVAHALEGAFRGGEGGVELFHVAGNYWIGQCELDDTAHDELEVGEQVVEGDEVEFRFDVRVFR